MYLQAPQKVWNFRKQKKNMLSTCHKWIKRKWKERCESNGFCTTLWGTTYPSSWWFLKLWQLWALFICCVHQNSFAANMYMNFYYLYMNFCYSYSNIERGPLFWVGPPFYVGLPFIEWGPLSISEGLTLIESVPFFSCDVSRSVRRGTFYFSQGHFLWVNPDSFSLDLLQISGPLSKVMSMDKWEKVVIIFTRGGFTWSFGPTERKGV